MQTRCVTQVPVASEIPWVALSLLGKIALFSDGIDDDRVLLSLFLKEVSCSDLRKSKYFCEVSMLISGEFSNVSLCYE